MFEKLLGALPVDTFFSEHWGRKPWVGKGGAAELRSQGSWDVVRRLVETEACDLITPRDGTMRQGPRPRAFDEARALFDQGYSLVFRQPDRHDVGLASLGRTLARELFARLNLHVYATPKGHGSFGWHFDPEDVFILQTEGVKRYALRENTLVPSPVIDNVRTRHSAEDEQTPIETFDVAAGDWLYIPRGFWHTTEALEDALSISVGLLPPTPLDVLDFLRAELSQSPEWRQRFPPLGSASQIPDAERFDVAREIVGGIATQLSRSLTSPLFTARFLAAFAAVKN